MLLLQIPSLTISSVVVRVLLDVELLAKSVLMQHGQVSRVLLVTSANAMTLVLGSGGGPVSLSLLPVSVLIVSFTVVKQHHCSPDIWYH